MKKICLLFFSAILSSSMFGTNHMPKRIKPLTEEEKNYEKTRTSEKRFDEWEEDQPTKLKTLMGYISSKIGDHSQREVRNAILFLQTSLGGGQIPNVDDIITHLYAKLKAKWITKTKTKPEPELEPEPEPEQKVKLDLELEPEKELEQILEPEPELAPIPEREPMPEIEELEPKQKPELEPEPKPFTKKREKQLLKRIHMVIQDMGYPKSHKDKKLYTEDLLIYAKRMLGSGQKITKESLAQRALTSYLEEYEARYPNDENEKAKEEKDKLLKQITKNLYLPRNVTLKKWKKGYDLEKIPALKYGYQTKKVKQEEKELEKYY